jgi:hypothetical protein
LSTLNPVYQEMKMNVQAITSLTRDARRSIANYIAAVDAKH